MSRACDSRLAVSFAARLGLTAFCTLVFLGTVTASGLTLLAVLLAAAIGLNVAILARTCRARQAALDPSLYGALQVLLRDAVVERGDDDRKSGKESHE